MSIIMFTHSDSFVVFYNPSKIINNNIKILITLFINDTKCSYDSWNYLKACLSIRTEPSEANRNELEGLLNECWTERLKYHGSEHIFNKMNLLKEDIGEWSRLSQEKYHSLLEREEGLIMYALIQPNENIN